MTKFNNFTANFATADDEDILFEYNLGPESPSNIPLEFEDQAEVEIDLSDELIAQIQILGGTLLTLSNDIDNTSDHTTVVDTIPNQTEANSDISGKYNFQILQITKIILNNRARRRNIQAKEA